MAINISWSTQGDVRIATLDGRIDSSNAREFEDLMLEGVEKEDRALLLEFSGITFISSAGLRIVLKLAKIYSKPKVFAVCSLPETVDEIFNISGFSQIVTVYKSPAEAVDAM